MKYIILYCLVPLFAWQTCSMKNVSSKNEIKSKGIIKDSIIFLSQVQPIFVSHCSPCHFPGGKMYERLPFDKDTTILHHETGILKRLKGEDNVLVKNFILQNKNGSSTDKPLL